MKSSPLLLGWLITALARLFTCSAVSVEVDVQEECPPCELLFSKLETTAEGARVQHVEVQERGEPKSGTTFSMNRAGGLLVHACDYFNKSFGKESCALDVEGGNPSTFKVSFTFEPKLSTDNARCACNGVDRVFVSVTNQGKHTLPVPGDCPWMHRNALEDESPPCRFANGTAPSNYLELWTCMEMAGCTITRDHMQMALFRDPRPMTVSTYYHRISHETVTGTVDEYVVRALPILCQWVALRFILFEGFMSDQQAAIFFYSEAMANPLAWHYHWLQSAGLNLPDSVVRMATDAAMNESYSFYTTGGMGVHHGGADATPSRSYLDEITEETASGLDAVLRTWLPPVLLAKFGVAAL